MGILKCSEGGPKQREIEGLREHSQNPQVLKFGHALHFTDKIN